MEIQIQSAEIKGGNSLKWSYKMISPERTTQVSASADAPVQEALAEAFKKLLPHFLLLTEMKGKPEVIKSLDLNEELPEEITRKYKVLSFSAKEKNGEVTIDMKGVKHLNIGKSIGIPGPTILPTDEYEFRDQLLTAIEELKNHVYDYMEGEQSERIQSSLGFEEEAENLDDFTPIEASGEAA